MSERASVVLVGCGCPLRSMGWYHAEQILDGRCPSASLEHIVEPWFMKESSKSTPGYDEFHRWRREIEKRGVKFYAAVNDVPLPGEGELRMAIISSRTADNPELMDGCLKIKCRTVFLEKPGAPSVVELRDMERKADDSGVKVFMGFNKNVSAYLDRTLACVERHGGSGNCDVTFLHNNAYANDPTELAECFERNAEGMLKNMAIHELAILVTFYGVTVDGVASAVADKEFSSCMTLKGPSSGRDYTDFVRLKFKITTKDGREVNVAADRCGGDDSVGIVSSPDGKVLGRFTMPDEEAIGNIPNLQKKYEGAMPYFFAQDPDYRTLKERVARNCVDGSPTQGVATIEDAIETLKLAEYLTPILQRQLLS